MKVLFIAAILFGFFLSDYNQTYLIRACPEFKESNSFKSNSPGQFTNR